MTTKVLTLLCSPRLNNSESESYTLLTFGMYRDHQVQLFYSKHTPRAMSSQVLIISKDTDSTIFLRNLLQYLNTITVKKFFIWMAFFVFQSVPTGSIPVSGKSSISTVSLQQTLPTLPIRYLNTLKRFFQAFSSFLGQTMAAVSASPHMGDAPVFNQFSALHRTHFSVSMCTLYREAQKRTWHSRNGLTNIAQS